MVHLVITFVIFFGVMAVTAVLFGGWVIVLIVKFAARMFFGPTPGQTRLSDGGTICGNQRCQSVNPAGARFCRRCGREIAPPQQINVRRAALW